jgi:hypothetical protein
MLTRSRKLATTTRHACAAGFVLLTIGVAPAAASVGGFEGGDGNQSCGDEFVPATDWACFTAVTENPILAVTDGSGANDDTVSGKDDTPGHWSITAGAVQSKSDITNVWRSSTEASPGHSFLNLALKRVGGAPSNGNFVFELNQKRSTFVNSAGTTVPCRTDGDVLVSYDLGASAVVGVSKWMGSPGAGDPADGSCPGGASGTWTGATSPTTYQAGVNAGPIDNALAGATGPFDPGTFGEASLDIAGIAGDLSFTKPCELFTSLQARSRASSSTSADLGDIVAATAISIAGCAPPPGGGGSAPAAPTLAGSSTCTAAGTVTLSGTAEAGSQVLISESGQSVGIADADATTGAWTATFAAADDTHGYTASAVNGTGASPSSGAVVVRVDGTPDAATTITSPAGGATVPAGALTVSGTAEPGSTVTLTDNGAAAGTATANGTGAWTITLAASAGSTHALSATAGDGCNASTGAATRAFTVSATTDGTGVGGTGTGVLNPIGGTDSTGSPLARYAVLGVTVGCATRPFSSYVNDKAKLLARVVFKIDGKTIATLRKRDKQGRFLLQVNPLKYKVGNHKLTLTLVPNSKTLKSRVVTKPFKRCSSCTSRRSFLIHLKKVAGQKLRSATVYVNGKRVKVLTGKRLRSRVTLTSLPKGTYKVRIRVVTVSGQVATSTRTYHTCTANAVAKKPVKKKI